MFEYFAGSTAHNKWYAHNKNYNPDILMTRKSLHKYLCSCLLLLITLIAWGENWKVNATPIRSKVSEPARGLVQIFLIFRIKIDIFHDGQLVIWSFVATANLNYLNYMWNFVRFQGCVWFCRNHNSPLRPRIRRELHN